MASLKGFTKAAGGFAKTNLKETIANINVKGKIVGIYTEDGHSSVYNYSRFGDEGRFSFPVEWRKIQP